MSSAHPQVWVNYQIMTTVSWNLQLEVRQNRVWNQERIALCVECASIHSVITWFVSTIRFCEVSRAFKTFERIFSLLDFSLLRLVPVACLVQYDFVTVGDISCSSLSDTAQRSGGVYVRHVAERVCRND